MLARAGAWTVVCFLVLPLTIVFPVALTDRRYLSLPQDGLSLRQAVDRLRAPAHERCRTLAEKVLRDLSAGPALVHDAIGDWEEGVENSLLVVLPRSPDADTLRPRIEQFRRLPHLGPEGHGLLAQQLHFRLRQGGQGQNVGELSRDPGCRRC